MCRNILFACFVVVLAGCNDLTSRVSGLVTIDGEPLEVSEGQRGTVVFRPVDGGPTTTAILDREGNYELATGSARAIAPGDYLVAVRVVEIIPPSESDSAPSGQPITPAIYADPLHSGFQFSVVSGDNRFDLDLDSSAGPVMAIQPEVVPEDAETEIDENALDSSTPDSKLGAEEVPPADGIEGKAGEYLDDGASAADAAATSVEEGVQAEQ